MVTKRSLIITERNAYVNEKSKSKWCPARIKIRDVTKTPSERNFGLEVRMSTPQVEGRGIVNER